jgi:hypothetical protein
MTTQAPVTTTAAQKATPKPKPKRKPGPPRLPRMEGEVLAVTRGGRVVFLTLDGRELARLNGYYAFPGTVPQFANRTRNWTLRNGRVVRVPLGVDPDFKIRGVGSHCHAIGRIPAGTLIGCYGDDGHPAPLILRDSSGKDAPLVPAPKDGDFGGHWESAFLSPDGSQLLLTWSDECEMPSAHLAPAAGGDPRSVNGGNTIGGPEAVAVGWTRDGRALAYFLPGGCGDGLHVPGVYAVDGTGNRVLVARSGGGGAALFPGD